MMGKNKRATALFLLDSITDRMIPIHHHVKERTKNMINNIHIKNDFKSELTRKAVHSKKDEMVYQDIRDYLAAFDGKRIKKDDLGDIATAALRKHWHQYKGWANLSKYEDGYYLTYRAGNEGGNHNRKIWICDALNRKFDLEKLKKFNADLDEQIDSKRYLGVLHSEQREIVSEKIDAVLHAIDDLKSEAGKLDSYFKWLAMRTIEHR